MDETEQIRLLRGAKDLHSAWYRETYPDVAMLGMEPAEHYLRYGTAIGRNPGKGFDTRFYLETYPDVAESGLNPLVHYLLHGMKEGRARQPAPNSASNPATDSGTDAALRRKARGRLRGTIRRLTTLGFDDRALEDLQAMVATADNPFLRAHAAREIALWHMRRKTAADYAACLTFLETAAACPEEPRYLARLAVIELLCHFHLGDRAAGLAVFDRAGAAGAATADVLLARANFEDDPAERIAIVNRALAAFDIPALTLSAEADRPAYDRLRAAAAAPPVARSAGPLVTVLVAAYNAADTLPTTLEALRAQSWQNLEILVIDDASTDATARVAAGFAARDDRIRLIRMSENGGAYVARNAGLDAAHGTYVTLQDADDWSHPLRIETQVRHLEAHPGAIGCTSQQARARSDLTFTRWSGSGIFIFTNTASFLFRRAPVREACGYWDTVRFAADNELIRRIERRFGTGAVTRLPTGPLSFQRDSDSSVVAHEFFGINGAPSGVRQEYLEAQLHHHARAESLRYGNDPARRPFPAPVSMHADRRRARDPERRFDVVLASDFRMVGGSTQSNAEEIAAQGAAGLHTGLVQMYRYDFDPGPERMMRPEIRDRADGTKTEVLTHGERAACDLLILRYPPILQHRQRYIPDIAAKDIRVIVNQPPMSDYGPDSVMRYDLAACAANLRHQFGKDATWHPIGPLVREALHRHHADELHHVDLSPEDWHNIIDIKGWSRGPRSRGPGDRLRIGRHGRDSAVKWPASRDDILAAYPARDDVEVHVLGGAKSPAEVIGGVPGNWTVHEFGARHPKDFLADIDVFVYFAHPDWVESFGRTIIEAMAVGVPVILPDIYRPLFADAALYATPQEAVAVARRLHADPTTYDAQARHAQDCAARQFSYEMHVARLQGAGVRSEAERIMC